jgi:hypothetical protein
MIQGQQLHLLVVGQRFERVGKGVYVGNRLLVGQDENVGTDDHAASEPHDLFLELLGNLFGQVKKMTEEKIVLIVQEGIDLGDPERGVLSFPWLCAYVNAHEHFQEYDHGDQRIE